jgi:cytochrome c oxidase subunit II
MVGVLFYFTARNENYIDSNPKPKVIVNVIGIQWTWEFQYPQYQVSNASAAFPIVTEVGEQWNPNVGPKQQHLPQLVIPTGETVRFNLYSRDVVHAFWVAPFEFKRQLLPDRPNRFTITATKTGDFIGRCGELCGVYHARMLFRIRIVTPAQFHSWVLSQQALQNRSGGAQ